MVKALLDTNILIDFLNAVPEARQEIERYADPAISVITWMEVMVGAPKDLEAPTLAFLTRFRVVDLDRDIAARAVDLPKRHRIKLPDAIVWACAQEGAMLLVTRNTKDFPADDPGVRAPYRL